ncbi:hypothetical protein [Paraliobacillus ryukyuensis]|uniref:hypothetical protein n=1 Tax=Paraliobacillus ryukyuensis TaxID=200904 RepID=UPI0015C48140|nr:hypothetical protein [Paraliobacillus ryukyuensis]
MIEAFLDYALGPHGRVISAFYMENQMILNIIVVGCGIGTIFYKNKKNKVITQKS